MARILNELTGALGIDAPAIEIENIQLDTRLITPGSLFLALKGHLTDGRRFIEKAIECGAIAVLYEDDGIFTPTTLEVPCIPVPSLSAKVSLLAGVFYGHPSKQMKLVGVTGTNGKSTTTHLIANWAHLLGDVSGVMGTLGNGLFGQLTETENTTGSAVSIQQQLHEFIEKDATLAAMEVSSHGLVQHRVESLIFAVSVFTNLSRDHLDYHHTMDTYAEAKRQIFTHSQSDRCIVNIDDETGMAWAKDMPDAVVYGVDRQFAGHSGKFVYASNVKFHSHGITIKIHSSWGNGVISAPLLGKFNVSNLLAALATLLVLQYDLKMLCQTASQLQSVTGRMECFGLPTQPLVVVDYAHTPDGLEKALEAARQHCHGKLTCICGCGGDRDKGKRPLMAEIAEKLADRVILTDDNPRTENPENIIEDMVVGLKNPALVAIEHDRNKAIDLALRGSEAGDIIVVAGKGHEDYQIIGTEKRHYSDRETVMQKLGVM